MPRVKIKKKDSVIDMTAMCDVAFLLLTFFILTGQFKPIEPLAVDIPSSTVKVKVPESEYATIYVGDEDKVFFGVIGQPIRLNMLERMIKRYNISLSEDEKYLFSLQPSFGIPMNELKAYLQAKVNNNKDFVETGIPLSDDKTNELSEWILSARYATKEISALALRLSIKADKTIEYPIIEEIIRTLQEQNINKFSLITSLESGGS